MIEKEIKVKLLDNETKLERLLGSTHDDPFIVNETVIDIEFYVIELRLPLRKVGVLPLCKQPFNLNAFAFELEDISLWHSSTNSQKPNYR